MTLGEIKSYCAAKLGINDAATKAQAGEFAKQRWQMIWNNQNFRQTRHQDTVAVTAGTREVTLPEEFQLVLGVRWAGSEGLLSLSDLTAFLRDPQGYDQSGSVLAYSQIANDASGNARIRLHRTPTTSEDLLVIGKRKCVPLVLDTDVPLIPGVDECLVAFTMGDLYQWFRQFGKAQLYYQEANALLAKMVEIETSQATEIRQIVPMEQMLESGYGAGDWME